MPDIGETDFLNRVATCRSGARGDAEVMEKIRQQENNRAPVQNVVEKRERRRDISAAVLWLKEEHLPDEPKNVAASLFWRHEQFHPVAEEQQRHLVAAPGGGNSQCAGDFSSEFAFGSPQRTEG